VLVTQELADQTGDSGVAFSDIGPVELKGIAGPVRLLAARRAG
jgi:class 3 adenylate cyclase